MVAVNTRYLAIRFSEWFFTVISLKEPPDSLLALATPDMWLSLYNTTLYVSSRISL